MLPEEKEIKDYEVAFLGKDEHVAEEALKVLTREKGEVFLQGAVQRIPLAYKIGKDASAFFGYFHFRVSPQSLQSIDRELRANPSVMRFLIVTPPLEKARPRWGLKPRVRTAHEEAGGSAEPEKAKIESLPLSNEELEKKIEEILQ